MFCVFVCNNLNKIETRMTASISSKVHEYKSKKTVHQQKQQVYFPKNYVTLSPLGYIYRRVDG